MGLADRMEPWARRFQRVAGPPPVPRTAGDRLRRDERPRREERRFTRAVLQRR